VIARAVDARTCTRALPRSHARNVSRLMPSARLRAASEGNHRLRSRYVSGRGTMATL
jgi:hypothetical protein